jgi:hypothetical protein
MMGIHSKFLVHWTGKDFTLEEKTKILERLKDNCKCGLYMNMGKEFIHGSNITTVTASASRVCFTEIRLSQAQKHSDLYGKLGIGFKREFVLERMGGPVFYVQNGSNSAVVEHFAHIHKYFRDNNVQIMIDRMNTILGFLKNLSDFGESELMYYEEMEWRIIQLKYLEDKNYITPQDSTKGIYRVNFKPEDVELIVFPDKETKQQALGDTFFKNFFKNHQPVFTTIEDCSNF